MTASTPLELDELSAIAQGFDIGAVHACEPLAAGTINSIYSLVADAGHFCLRVNAGKTGGDLRYEAELLDALVAAGVPAPLPRPATGGERFLVHRGHLLSVFPWLDGRHLAPAEVTPGHARAVGQALARMHVAGLPLAARFERAGIYTFERICARVADIDSRLGQRPEAHRDPRLVAALGPIRDEMAWLEARAPVRAAALRGVIHNDLFPDNVLFAHDRIAALIDFEQASTGSLCYDLAVCLNAWCFDGDFDPGVIGALIHGYRAVRELEPAEVHALPVEVRAAAMRFTVTRITDVYLPGHDKPGLDFGDFLRRLERWREIDPRELLRWGGFEE